MDFKCAILLSLGILLICEFSMIIISLCRNNVFYDGILQIMTINAIFLIQISFNINFILKVIYHLYKNIKINNYDIININFINVILLIIIMATQINEYVVTNNFNNSIIICSI